MSWAITALRPESGLFPQVNYVFPFGVVEVFFKKAKARSPQGHI